MALIPSPIQYDDEELRNKLPPIKRELIGYRIQTQTPMRSLVYFWIECFVKVIILNRLRRNNDKGACYEEQ